MTGPILIKSVSFNLSFSEPSTEPSNDHNNKRRSLIKLGTELPIRDETTYSHSDPLLRRLRLKNHNLIPCNLAKEFNQNIKIVLFLFG